MESYKLTQDEAEQAIREAQIKKEAAVKYDEEIARRRKWEAELQRPWSPEDLLTFINWKAKRNGIDFIIDDANRNIINLLCQYFTGDKEFEKENRKLHKGIMLCGPIGTGKSTLMSLFSSNQRQCYKRITCNDIADRYSIDGEEVLQIWCKLIKVPTHQSTFFQREIGACFEDLGTEEDKMHFGSSVNVMGQILQNRYDRKVPYHYTHLTTNLTGDEIENRYGARVRSRCREMFNMLVLGGEDRRK